ncbi:MAG: 3-hydroxyacyl-CoA dehydrogenase family protein [Thermoanaerobaculia bacterium]|nr:3-hydroxyacyl-CoA dehydrogenase family protein [Thermoanaerobaculia bacterium]
MNIDDIRKICVTGAGQMGAQIAIQGALHGYRVSLHDIEAEQLERAISCNRKHLMRRVEKGRMTESEVQEVLERVDTTSDLGEACADADFVVEAVVERLDVKRRVFAELDEMAPRHAILATNSSYLGNSRIADVTSRPDKVVNMHFFYPPLVMKLVEVVRGDETSDETVAVTMELARRIGKQPVRVNRELPGFLVNRILRAITNEAYFLLENGVASFEDIDKACELGLNHPLGPFKLGDFSGLDIGYNARKERYEETGDPADRPAPSLARRVERGDLGRKTGRGFYDYSTNPPTPTED